MKKIIYTLIFAAVATLTISSCTETEVKPAKTNFTAGTGPMTDPL